MTESQKVSSRSYAWNYFAYHAEQRVKTFHIYILLVAGIFTGLFAAINAMIKMSHYYYSLLAPFGILLAFLSRIFFRLDQRNANLVKNGEKALKFLDQLEYNKKAGARPHVLELFAFDDYLMGKLRSHGVKSYSEMLKLVFNIFGFVGLAIAIAGITLDVELNHESPLYFVPVMIYFYIVEKI